MSRPELAGYSHMSFSVRDLDTSERFYREVLGFEVIERPPGHGWTEVMLGHRASGTVVGLQCHEANAGEPFHHARTGMDHFSMRVASRDELERWVAWLDEHGVEHSPVHDMPYGYVVVLRDPDHIQLELFVRKKSAPDEPWIA